MRTTKQSGSWTAILALACALAGVTTAHAEDLLNNQGVVEMKQLGFSDELILEKIHSSSCQFDTSLDALKGLRAAGISDAVIGEMIRATKREPAAAKAVADPADPLSPHDPGVYWFKPEGQGGRMTKVPPNASTQSKTGGIWKSAFTYGAAKIKHRAILEGEQSTTVVDGARPEFYFHFGKAAESFGGVTSELFALVRLRLNKGNREMIVGTYNITGGEGGAIEKWAVEFESQEMAPGIYKVVPKEDIVSGEYAFYYAGDTAAPGGPYGGAGGMKVFDFSLQHGAAPPPESGKKK